VVVGTSVVLVVEVVDPATLVVVLEAVDVVAPAVLAGAALSMLLEHATIPAIRAPTSATRRANEEVAAGGLRIVSA
jgi:hypothetical protein